MVCMKHIERGNRLKLCRSMLQKTLKELGAMHQVSIGSLSNWESGTSSISEKNVHKIIGLLASEGLICTKEWLLEGTGDAPYLYASTPHNLDKKEEPFDLTSQFLFFKEIEAFKKTHPEMLITLIKDDSMHPFLKTGDYVGGIILAKTDYIMEQGNICIVETKKRELLVRQFFIQSDKVLLLSKSLETENNFLLLDEEPLKVARLTFMRRF